MGEVTLRLEIDRATGRKNVLISYRSDDGELPMEHEQEHRALVDKLIQGGALKAAELGRVVVRREADAPAAEPEKKAAETHERAALSE